VDRFLAEKQIHDITRNNTNITLTLNRRPKMNQRREFLRGLACTTAGATLGARKLFGFSTSAQRDFPTARPAPSQRKFVSRAVEAKIAEVKRAIADPELAWLFENCFPNTLDTTVTFGVRDNRPDTLVITGDINAMWLRDSTAQVAPYLPFARKDKKLQRLIAGVINRQTVCILIDRYANAFSFEAKACPWGVNDKPPLSPELCERKWEIDSLCYPIRLSHSYWKRTGDTSCFHSDWHQASRLIVKTFREQQRLNGPGPYTFQRMTDNPIDTPPFNGLGNPMLILSADNPYFFRGRAGEGIGGPHVGVNMIWPLGIIVRALTSTDDREILYCLRMLKNTHARTGFMHEAFDKDDPKKFTRSWFAWANTIFGELILKLYEQRPHLLKAGL
jgi:meiotically up-regulated gene 157 (Mug157) protein